MAIRPFHLRWDPAALAAVTVAVALPAHAALINDYSMSDDVWNTPISAGHFLIDTRTTYLTGTPGILDLPILSLVAGVAAGTEVGIWSAYTWSGFETGPFVGAPALLDPYVKTQLPWQFGPLGFGLVGGAQVPTQPGMEHDVAVEGVGLVTLPGNWSMDVDLGIGRTFVTPATLAHLLFAGYDSLPLGQTLLVETSVTTSTAAPPLFYVHAGMLFPLSGSSSSDASLGMVETAGSLAVMPQFGWTITL